MAKSPEQLRLELRGLRQAFLAQLPDRVQALEAALHEVLVAEEIDRQRIEALFHLAHRLSGAAGVYGCPAVHVVADAIERAAEDLLDAGGKDEPRLLDELRQLLEALKRASEDTGGRAFTAE